jgi:lipopolysaccharide export system protein LptA
LAWFAWLVVACCPSADSLAQAPAELAQPGGNLPIQIQADSGIEWQQNANVYIARGNAVATRGPTTVRADTLIAHYREAKGVGNTGGNTEIYRIDAEGNVTITRNGDTVTGDHGVYDVEKAVAVITGHNLKLVTPTDTVTARDSFDWYDEKQIAVARGDAVAIRNGKTIRADILTGYLVKTAPGPAKPSTGAAKPSPAGTRAAASAKPGAGAVKPPAAGPEEETSKLDRMDAQGHVVVTNGADIGQGDYGVYNAVSGIVTLIGNVVITRGKDVIRGQYAVMDLNTNVSRMMPSTAATTGPHQPVRGLFVRRDQGTGAALPGQGKAP